METPRKFLQNLGVCPGLALLPARTVLPRLKRGGSAESPAHPAWLRPDCPHPQAQNYCSQKAVRVQQGSGGGGGRKGSSGGGGGGGGCPPRWSIRQPPRPGRKTRPRAVPATLGGGPGKPAPPPARRAGAGCRALGSEAAGAAGGERRARQGWRERWSSSTA